MIQTQTSFDGNLRGYKLFYLVLYASEQMRSDKQMSLIKNIKVVLDIFTDLKN